MICTLTHLDWMPLALSVSLIWSFIHLVVNTFLWIMVLALVVCYSKRNKNRDKKCHKVIGVEVHSSNLLIKDTNLFASFSFFSNFIHVPFFIFLPQTFFLFSFFISLFFFPVFFFLFFSSAINLSFDNSSYFHSFLPSFKSFSFFTLLFFFFIQPLHFLSFILFFTIPSSVCFYLLFFIHAHTHETFLSWSLNYSEFDHLLNTFLWIMVLALVTKICILYRRRRKSLVVYLMV